MKYLIILFLFLTALEARSQFIFADPPFVINTSTTVTYKSNLSLPTDRDNSITRTLKVDIQRTDTILNPIFVLSRNNYIWYNYVDKINEKDSSFKFTSEGIGSFVQFIFSPDSSVKDIGKNGIFGFSPTIQIPYGIKTSVIVDPKFGFSIYPNPVDGKIVDVRIPGNFPYASTYTRFRVLNMLGLVEIDVPLVELEFNAPTIAFENLKNGMYLAQIINSLLNISQTFQFIVNR